MTSAADIAFYERHLVKTLDKSYTLFTLREWRKEATSPEEANAFADLVDAIESGILDG